MFGFMFFPHFSTISYQILLPFSQLLRNFRSVFIVVSLKCTAIQLFEAEPFLCGRMARECIQTRKDVHVCMCKREKKNVADCNCKF